MYGTLANVKMVVWRPAFHVSYMCRVVLTRSLHFRVCLVHRGGGGEGGG